MATRVPTAGEMFERVTFQSKSVTKNSLGEEVIVWQDLASVWAQVEPLTGRKFLAAAQLQVEIALVVRVRYRTDLMVDGLRLVWRGAAYDIQGKARDIDARQTHLEFNCASGVHDAR